MAEYAEKFINFGCFPAEVMVNELKKARRFEKGLRPKLYHQIIVFALLAYKAVLEKAQLVKTL